MKSLYHYLSPLLFDSVFHSNFYDGRQQFREDKQKFKKSVGTLCFFFPPEFFYLEQSWQNDAQIASTFQIGKTLRIHSECVCFSHDCVTSAPKVRDSTHAF